MAKMTLNELKHQIADILDEAKKSKKSSKKSSKKAPQVEAFGYYDSAHDFSQPQGAANLYRQQGAVNWGPYTSSGPEVSYQGNANPNGGSNAKYMKETDEKALRALVREVIENGLVDESSAWAPFLTSKEPIFESTWEEAAYRLTEAWYDDFKKGDKKKDSEGKEGKKAKGYEKTEFGSVKKHGEEKKEKKSSKK